MYKIKSGNDPTYLIKLFCSRVNTYDVRYYSNFNLPKYNTVKFGKKSFKYYGTRLWGILHAEVKNSTSLSNFRYKLDKWISSVNNNDYINSVLYN